MSLFICNANSYSHLEGPHVNQIVVPHFNTFIAVYNTMRYRRLKIALLVANSNDPTWQESY